MYPPPIRNKTSDAIAQRSPTSAEIKKVWNHSYLLNELQETPEDTGVNMRIISIVDDFCNRQNFTLTKSGRYLELY